MKKGIFGQVQLLKVATEVYFHQVYEHSKKKFRLRACHTGKLASAIPLSSNFGPVFVEINLVFAGTGI